MQLFPYQIEGAKFLVTAKRALLADDMGLGKSAQAIEACNEVCVVGDHVEVVCPASLVENWIREIERFKRSNWTYSVCSYDRATRAHEANKETTQFAVLILDEAHYLKSPKAKRTKAIFGAKCDGVGGLVSRAAHVFCLTGTPTPNNPSELWPMLRAVMPGAVGREHMAGKPHTFWTFVEKYCVTQDTGFGIKIVRGKNLGELKERISPWVLRRKKEEVLKDLPPIRFDTLALEGKFGGARGVPLLADEVRAIEKALAADGVAGLKALAPHVAQLRRVTGLAKAEAASEWIDQWFESGGGKLVVFAHHRDVIAELCRRAKPEWRACALTGSNDSSERQFIVDDFQKPSGSRLFIGQIQAAGTGLTLTAASDVLFVESSWVPAENQQAAMRIHRVGQNRACVVRFAMLAGSIDEDIQRAVMRKTTDIERLWV